MLDREQHPLLLLSASGTHEVGTIVGCLRRLQQWSLSGAIDEYRSFAAPTPRLSCEQFIETWDPDLAPPPRAHPPPWFESQCARPPPVRAARDVARDSAALPARASGTRSSSPTQRRGGGCRAATRRRRHACASTFGCRERFVLPAWQPLLSPKTLLPTEKNARGVPVEGRCWYGRFARTLYHSWVM